MFEYWILDELNPYLFINLALDITMKPTKDSILMPNLKVLVKSIFYNTTLNVIVYMFYYV